LSPCADDLMTPNNILNMSMLKELDIVSITDHNSTKQLPVFEQLIDSYDMLFIPGCEVTVLEGFDVLCLFKTFHDAYAFGDILEDHLIDHWGPYTKENQIITDVYDLSIDTFDKSLQATDIPYKELVNIVRKYEGILILAHIDRTSQSPLTHFRLENIEFDGLGIQKHFKDEYLSKNEYLNDYNLFISSDSHSLLSISEKEYYIELEEKTIDCFFKTVKGDKNE